MPLQQPQQQAGVLSFYDAPEKGPSLNVKIVLIVIVIFLVVVLLFNHATVL